MRRKITADQEAILKGVARRLPPTFTYARTTGKITGAEAMLTGLEPPKGVEAFDPKEEYLHTVPLQVPVNHYRRIRHAFQSGGPAAVQKYVAKFQAKEEATNG